VVDLPASARLRSDQSQGRAQRPPHVS
jgi:hypothetical protein